MPRNEFIIFKLKSLLVPLDGVCHILTDFILKTTSIFIIVQSFGVLLHSLDKQGVQPHSTKLIPGCFAFPCEGVCQLKSRVIRRTFFCIPWKAFTIFTLNTYAASLLMARIVFIDLNSNSFLAYLRSYALECIHHL